MPETHLMTVDPASASMILTGQKLIEGRLASDPRQLPQRVAPRDTLYIRARGQRIVGKAVVHRVDLYDGLGSGDLRRLRDLYEDRVKGGDALWQAPAGSAIFIALSKPLLLRDESTVPAELTRAGDVAWFTLWTEQPRLRQAA